jgi:hypothetical protein
MAKNLNIVGACRFKMLRFAGSRLELGIRPWKKALFFLETPSMILVGGIRMRILSNVVLHLFEFSPIGNVSYPQKLLPLVICAFLVCENFYSFALKK